MSFFRKYLIKAATSALLALPLAANGIIKLTKTNGVSMSGVLISCSDSTRTIRIREQSGITQHKVEELNNESQETVAHWRSDQKFLKRSSLTAQFDRSISEIKTNITGTVTDRRTNKKTEEVIGYKTQTFHTYNVQLTNKSDLPINNLIVDYRIYYILKLSEKQTAKCQLAGSAECSSLQPNGLFTFKTTPFLHSTRYRSAPRIRWNGKPADNLAEISGTHLRIRKKNHAGEWIEREIEHGEVPRRRDREDFQKVYR